MPSDPNDGGAEDHPHSMFMSEEMVAHFEAKLKSLDIMIKMGVAVLAFVFGLGVWVSTQEWRMGSVSNYVDRLDKEFRDHGTVLQEFKEWRAGTDANRFTSQDYAKASMQFQDALLTHDKRLTRTEDSVARIEKGIDRLETKLGTKP